MPVNFVKDEKILENFISCALPCAFKVVRDEMG
jgi:hypothetical protein